MPPLISVVITAFNRSDTICRAIESVVGQTYSNYEIVVVDDASTDDTVEVVARLENPRIRLIRNERNRGIGGAKNVGIQSARGQYIAFLDSDDDWAPQKLEVQLHQMEASPEIPLCFSAFWVYRLDKGKVVLRRPKKIGSWRNSVLVGETFSLGSTLLATRALFEQIGGFNEGLTRLQDRDWTLRYFDKYSDFLFISEPLARIYNSGWPNTATVEHSTRALFEANRNRLARWFDGAPELFSASLNFEVAVAKYRAGNAPQGIVEIINVMRKKPALTPYIAGRIWRKLREGDFD